MNNPIIQWRARSNELDVERQLMNTALARLGGAASSNHPARLIFGLDLTGSRAPSLDQARIATAAMFDCVRQTGRIEIKLVYFRGADECRATDWHDDPDVLSRSMRQLKCEAGETQIPRLLRVALAEPKHISGVVFVGDHCENNFGELRALAKKLGERSIPVFVFHECADHDDRSLKAKPVFKHLAEDSGGVYVEFKPDSGVVLKEMLSGLAAFSAGGNEGIARIALPSTPEARQLHKRLLLGPPSPIKGGHKP